MSDTHPSPNASGGASKREERRAFILLAVFFAPALAVAIVGGWGFFIWMLQIINGPPTG